MYSKAAAPFFLPDLPMCHCSVLISLALIIAYLVCGCAAKAVFAHYLVLQDPAIIGIMFYLTYDCQVVGQTYETHAHQDIDDAVATG